MLNLFAALPADRPLTILCLGAHSDDIEIGCGGSLLHLSKTHPSATVHWQVFSASGSRAQEARSSAEDVLSGFADSEISIHEFNDSRFPEQYSALKDAFTGLAKSVSPDIVFTHHGEDKHQDHRLVSELTWNAFRDHWILEYEIPKYDGDLGRPNVYFSLSNTLKDEKLRLLKSHFGSQADKDWFSDELFTALLRLRGMECRSPSGYAEAYHCRKLSFRFPS